MAVADAERVPAGKALAVDRERFAAQVTARIEVEPLITLVHRAISSLDAPELAPFERVVVAAGLWPAKSCPPLWPKR